MLVIWSHQMPDFSAKMHQSAPPDPVVGVEGLAAPSQEPHPCSWPGRNFGIKGGGTNLEGERGALGSRGESGGEWGGIPPHQLWV